MESLYIDTWAGFKSLIATKALLIQYSNLSGGSYDLYAPEGGVFMWRYKLTCDGGADQIDFETNYKPTANAPIEMKAGASRPQRITSSPQPLNTISNFIGFALHLGLGAATGSIDVAFSTVVYLRGGVLRSANSQASDIAQMDSMLKANDQILMAGMVSGLNVTPNFNIEFRADDCTEVPVTVKLRITITRTSVLAASDYYVMMNVYKPLPVPP